MKETANQQDTLAAELEKRAAEIKKGGAPKYHEKNAAQGKLFVRERLNLLLDDGLEVEDGLFANCLADGLPADGVVTGIGKINGRTVCVMANDSTVKAGSWGARTVEKIIRIQETAEKLRCPIIYLVDSAGARITDQLEMFPGRRGAGRIFYNEVKLSGKVPQVCLLFGPSAAGGAYIPAFCDIVIMVEGNASMYLGSPRMAEMVIGEKVTLEEMGGARMHCTVSGCGDVLVKTEEEAIAYARRYLSYFPSNYSEKPPVVEAKPPKSFDKTIEDILPENQNAPFNMYDLIERIIDEGSFCEIKKLFAPEIITGLARLAGQPIGIIANQPRVKGGVLFHDSADKAAKFITLCDAFHIPLLFLADVPGFMIGTKVERVGIIRHGAKMIAAMSEATVPKISVIVRKAYGAGLYAMAGPAFEPDCCLALPNAQIAVMGPEAAVNAVYANKIAELPPEERAAFVEQKREEYRRDIDIYRLASELVVDGIVAPNDLRNELIRRFDAYMSKYMVFSERKHGVYPV
ncbi:acyl-CoA carboxylase subunit beta [Geobacillus kaustophilus NBRC 102445]|uniref:acyl-CoA carboxylase subunit beta n=1 Tax=Geobacillus thermoleovorans group TaxID=1505648 RepID=UPI0005A5F667|nr:acyl-CoA carboxylase subunit beta [Geobacillus kaustophilus]MED4973575.1 acyl-CoA carboxylase subunit beta [Geobacillus thermoleovorans]QCK82855.1 acyl-CoA carboxylase subunit beta [Geobacillus kaustophilus NBRC 102445]